MPGSSPRAWGTLGSGGVWMYLHRFIPTGVGNASRRARQGDSRTVHPHGRGERAALYVETGGCYGSSPRAWGTLTPQSSPSSAVRFIPSGVGIAATSSFTAAACPVHPHGRGERVQRPDVEGGRGGSSPRAWGTQTMDAITTTIRRFIPTGVGNASTNRRPTPSTTVHPHGRGERVIEVLARMVVIGSSPRAWGTPSRAVPKRRKRRFIPTGVGNAPSPGRRRSRRPVHPHGRGERLTVDLLRRRASGSSPRAWGTRGGDEEGQGGRRFIPTGVGNARPPPPGATPPAVHPHGRGERVSDRPPKQYAGGSSPRAWGTPPNDLHASPPRRFIPTGVGNAPASGAG